MDKLIGALQQISVLAESTPELEEDFTEEQAMACDKALSKIAEICRIFIKPATAN